MPTPEQGPGDTLTQVRETVAAYGARLALGAVIGIVISRSLHPEGRGAYAVVVLIASIATALGHLSIGQANVGFWNTDRKAIPATNLLLGPQIGALSALVVGAVVLLWRETLVPGADPWLIAIALATVPVAVPIVHMTMITLLLGKLNVVNRSITLAALVQCILLLLAAWAGMLSTGVVVAVWVVVTTIQFGFLFPTIRPHLQGVDLGLARRLIRAGSEYHVGVVALFFLLRIDVLLLNALSTTARAGLYTLAVSVGEMAYAGTDALSQSMMRRQAEHQLDRSGDITTRTTRLAILISVLSVGFLCAVAPFAIPFLYGSPFRDSVPALWALAPGLVAYTITRALTTYLLRLGRPRVMSGFTVLALATNISLNLILIPVWGIVGCALASSASYVLYALCYANWFGRSVGLPVYQLLPGRAEVQLLVDSARRTLQGRGRNEEPA